MRCAACDFENPDGMRFCGSCASPLPARCPRCAFENPAGFRFCGSCSEPLGTQRPTGPRREPRAYTPKHLLERILVSRSAIEGERKQVTVLFADIVRSMELAEQVDAEEWHRILDGFFTILAEGVHRFEGTINQFTGDGVMALFGAPIAHEDHARRACYAALHLSEALRRHGEELKRTRGLGLAVRMGLNSGEVVVGRIGDDLRMDYTAQGHTVGLAARMEQLAGPDRIYLSEHTAALVSGFFRLRDLGQFTVKGVLEPLRVHELEGVGSIRTRLDVSRARGFTRFVGRDDEMKVLEAALAHALEGAGGGAGVVGEPGVGKSRLCHELLERCRARGIRSVEAHAMPHGKMIPLLPWIEVLRAFFGITEQDTAEMARDKIAGRTLRLDETLADRLPVLFDFLGVPDPARPSPLMDPEARHRQLIEITWRLEQARSLREPMVVLFEDLHWMDSGSEAFLAAMVDILAETRTLLVCTFRPGYRAPWMDRSFYRQLSLSPLGPVALTELLDGLLGNDPSLAGLAPRIIERTGGNPFFVEEVVQSLLEAGSLEGSPGAYRCGRPVEELGIPASVHSILAARIDRLGEREKTVLQAAAVIGKDFQEPVLSRVVEIPPDDLRAALAKLVSAELLHAGELFPVAEYAFKHPLTQEVAYRSQLAARRSLLHERVARALAEVHAEKLDERASLLSHHFEMARDDLEAARWSRRAARWVRSSNLAEALRHWRRTLKLLEEVPESTDTVPLGLEATSAMLHYGWILGISAEEADGLFSSGRKLAERAGDDRALAILTAHYAAIHAAHRDVEKYVSLSQEAARIAERLGDAGLRAAMWPPLVRSHLLAGRLRDALALCEQAFSEIPADPQLGVTLGYSPYVNLLQIRANLLAFAGRWSDAVEAFERAASVVRTQGHEALLDSITSDHAWWAAILGDPATALVKGRRGLELSEKLGTQLTRVYAYNSLGAAFLSARQWSDAVIALEEALRIAREMHTGEEVEVLALAHLAEARLALGEVDRATELARRAVGEAQRHRALAAECLARLVETRVLLSTGNRDEAAHSLERARGLVEETGAACYEPFVRIEYARLARSSGDEASFTDDLRTAQRLFTGMGADILARSIADELSKVEPPAP